MEMKDFKNAIQELEAISTPLTERQAEIYFKHLKRYPESLLRIAVHTLVETYTYKRFPMPKEIRDVIDRAQVREVSHAEANDLDYYDQIPCSLCGNTGFVLSEKQDKYYPYPRIVGEFCPQCQHGAKRKEGWRRHFEREKLKTARRQERIYEPEMNDDVPF